MKKEDNKENNPQEELESLYQKVSRNDHADGDIAEAEDLAAYYAVLQVKPDASPAEIAQSYEQLKDTWREDRFINVEAWQVKSREKLREIENAYEKIVSLRLYESNGVHRKPAANDPAASSNDPAFAFLPEEPENIPGEIDKITINPNKRLSNRMLRWLIGTVVAMMVMIGGLFLWPTMYHYESIMAGDKVFPLRVHRMTSMTTYFNGREWVNPPIPVEASRNTATPSTTVLPSARAPEAQPVSAPEETVKSASPSPKAEEAAPPKVEPKKTIPAELTPELRKSAPAAPGVQKKPLKTAAAVLGPTGKSMRFSIQIKAFREESKARTFLQEMPAHKGNVCIERAIYRDRSIWYRVHLGEFGSKDQALRYLKENRISETYPGSFIQNTGGASCSSYGSSPYS